MEVFRIFPARYRSTAFTGIGGLYAARRWNHLGTAMVYCATSRALAAMEFFVNLEPIDAPDDLLMAAATVPDDVAEELNPSLLPENWRELDNLICRDLGSNWVKSARSAALLVPSIVVEGDKNVLLNSAHPDFPKVVIAEPIPFHFDPRMFH
ncbi:MAG: RES family NAD+ phosphorylase [Terracidiphilus sp.]|jgi:RES domain-containing protein